MSNLVSPIYTGTVNGHAVRFFKAPTGRPEMPWHSVDDLYASLGLPRQIRRQLLSIMRKQMGKEGVTVATAEGLVVIASHPLAQGLVAAAKEAATFAGHVLPDIGLEYAMEGGEAMKNLAGDLPPEAEIAFCLACFRNTHGTDEGAA